MNQQEVLEVLSTKFRSGAITRRQFMQAAAFFGLGAGVAPLAASAAPASRGISPHLAPQADGEVRFLIAEAFPDTWDPYQHTIQAQRRIEQQVFDSLWQIETADVGNFSPGLAESWTQVDELTVECKLRQGVTFHKGQAFTAADVKASIERASGATGETVVSALSMVPTTVEVVDDVTVRLKTQTPFAPLFSELAGLPILSATDIQPAADSATPAAGAETLKAAPNGTGPFMLTGNDQNVKTMEANASYWGGTPAIKTLVWEYIIDSQTRLNALLAGQAQVLDRVPPEHLAVLQSNPNITLISNTGFENVNLWMRQDAPAPWDYASVKLREAVMWGIDREGIVKSLVQGASEVSVTHIPNHALYAQPQDPQMQINVMAWLTVGWAVVLVAARENRRYGGRLLASLSGLSVLLFAYNVWSIAPLRGLDSAWEGAIQRMERESNPDRTVWLMHDFDWAMVYGSLHWGTNDPGVAKLGPAPQKEPKFKWIGFTGQVLRHPDWSDEQLVADLRGQIDRALDLGYDVLVIRLWDMDPYQLEVATGMVASSERIQALRHMLREDYVATQAFIDTVAGAVDRLKKRPGR